MNCKAPKIQIMAKEAILLKGLNSIDDNIWSEASDDFVSTPVDTCPAFPHTMKANLSGQVHLPEELQSLLEQNM